MILVTGGTGFIGRHLVRSLVNAGRPVRILLRPSVNSPKIPHGIPVEVAVSSLNDFKGLRAAMKDINFVFHLAGSERHGSQANLNSVDVEGTKMVIQAAAEAGVKRFITLSHLGANRSSAFPVLKAKGIAEKWILDSNVPYTIFRTDAVFGPGDQFSEPILRLLRRSPGLFLLPGQGDTVLQPLWVEDLVTCLTLSLDQPETANRIFSVGGIELLTYREIVQQISRKVGIHRLLVPYSLGHMRNLTLWVDQMVKDFPISIFWLDTLAENRTCAIDAMPREFGILPVRFNLANDYLLQVRGK